MKRILLKISKLKSSLSRIIYHIIKLMMIAKLFNYKRQQLIFQKTSKLMNSKNR